MNDHTLPFVTIILGCLIGFMFIIGDTVPQWGGDKSVHVLPPCDTEDSDNCYWDASRSGNGEGMSFVVINGDVIYLAPKGR